MGKTIYKKNTKENFVCIFILEKRFGNFQIERERNKWSEEIKIARSNKIKFFWDIKKKSNAQNYFM